MRYSPEAIKVIDSFKEKPPILCNLIGMEFEWRFSIADCGSNCSNPPQLENLHLSLIQQEAIVLKPCCERLQKICRQTHKLLFAS